ncbi:gas vesicle protein [Dactylosporangium sp. CA-139066]|uniref:gas vesicle protein n=1 Tax=Dactylosporangium sp. CA-139066 TaxID=3239930 RepID=UPI003D93EE05
MTTTEVSDPVGLVDLLDRLLAKGVVITGDVTLSIAGVDLVYLSLRALVTSVGEGGPLRLAAPVQQGAPVLEGTPVRKTAPVGEEASTREEAGR